MDKKLVGGIAASAGVVAITGAALFAALGGVQPAPTPTPTSVVSIFEINGYAEAPPKPTPEPVVVEAPPAPEPEPVAEDIDGAPGDLVPFIASDDPNNALGGDYIDPGIYCQNGSASGNPPVCD